MIGEVPQILDVLERLPEALLMDAMYWSTSVLFFKLSFDFWLKMKPWENTEIFRTHQISS